MRVSAIRIQDVEGIGNAVFVTVSDKTLLWVGQQLPLVADGFADVLAVSVGSRYG